MRKAIDRAIESGKLEEMTGLLEGARTPEIRYAVKQIVRSNGGEEPLVEHAQRWIGRPEQAARHIACGLLVESYKADPHETFTLLLVLADDTDWTVRESAGEACGTILQHDFARGLETLREWCGHPSENVRRTVIIAVMKAAQTRQIDWGEPLLKLIEPLLTDRRTTLRRTLGPLALGSVLLRTHPGITFEYLIKWSTSIEEQVLWNVAMAFSGTGGPLVVKKALIILRKLSLDERRYVWRAVASAMWKLGRKKPEIVRPELARWLGNERRVDVAREALKYL
ncbi:MAG: DNA alkylation repair protein [Candidatus Bipolaricaulota bacterium]|nr:DNA alkylation repair protein [Candidatus Bipolaricaulota bacterium]